MDCNECGTPLIGDEASYLEYDGLCYSCWVQEERDAKGQDDNADH